MKPATSYSMTVVKAQVRGSELCMDLSPTQCKFLYYSLRDSLKTLHERTHAGKGNLSVVDSLIHTARQYDFYERLLHLCETVMNTGNSGYSSVYTGAAPTDGGEDGKA